MTLYAGGGGGAIIAGSYWDLGARSRQENEMQESSLGWWYCHERRKDWDNHGGIPVITGQEGKAEREIMLKRVSAEDEEEAR